MTSKIQDMFADAIEAAESNDEFSADLFTKKNLDGPVNIETKEPTPTQVEVAPTPEPIVEEVVEPTPEPIVEEVVEPVITNVDVPQEVIVSKVNSPIALEQITLVVNAVRHYDVLTKEKYSDSINNYLIPDKEEVTVDEVIFSAINVPTERIHALRNICTAHSHDGAARAFFLLSQSEERVDAIASELNDLVGLEDEDFGSLAKLDKCRSLEHTINGIEPGIVEIVEKIATFLEIAKGE